MNKAQAVESATRQFEISGRFLRAYPYGSGHIHDTFCAEFDCDGQPSRYIVQRVNRRIFNNPAVVMENIQRVTAHLAARLIDQPDGKRRVLTLVLTRDGKACHVDADGDFWRAYEFIENAHTYDTVQSTAQAFQAGKAFGEFQMMVSTLPAPRLHDTIPDFHHTPKRFAALVQAVEADVAKRARLAKSEIDFAYSRQGMTDLLLRSGLPERVTHNDTKFNNVMLDDATGEGICVIDLDTVMPGLALYDFGDMVRTTTSPAPEDERDLAKVTMQFPMFEALARGYLDSAGAFLMPSEKEHLVASGKLITFEIGIRFLADYLLGDTYFKVHREGHNLDRCRTQFKLLQSIEHQEERMLLTIASIT